MADGSAVELRRGRITFPVKHSHPEWTRRYVFREFAALKYTPSRMAYLADLAKLDLPWRMDFDRLIEAWSTQPIFVE